MVTDIRRYLVIGQRIIIKLNIAVIEKYLFLHHFPQIFGVCCVFQSRSGKMFLQRKFRVSQKELTQTKLSAYTQVPRKTVFQTRCFKSWQIMNISFRVLIMLLNWQDARAKGVSFRVQWMRVLNNTVRICYERELRKAYFGRRMLIFLAQKYHFYLK